MQATLIFIAIQTASVEFYGQKEHSSKEKACVCDVPQQGHQKNEGWCSVCEEPSEHQGDAVQFASILRG